LRIIVFWLRWRALHTALGLGNAEKARVFQSAFAIVTMCQRTSWCGCETAQFRKLG